MALLRSLQTEEQVVSVSRNRFQRAYEKQTKPRYWKILALKKRAQFWLRRNSFYASRFFRGKLKGTRYFGSIVFRVIASFLFALVIVVISLTIEHFLPTVKMSSFTGMLAVLVQVSGIFIGLYFAALSLVASTVYSRVPAGVRRLLMTEKVSNLYIWVVAVLGVVSLLLLAASALGHEPGVVCLVIVAVLGGISIFAFVKLGMGIFNLFNPATLAPYVIEDLRDWIEAVTSSGTWSKDPSFQAHYRVNAADKLATFEDIVNLVSGPETFDSAAVEKLAVMIAGLLPMYCENKSAIPVSSEWFRPIARHRNWLTADFMEVNFALSTGTAVLPKRDSDSNWFEEHTYSIIKLALSRLVSRDEVATATRIILELGEVLFDLGKELNVRTAAALLENLGEVVMKAVENELPANMDNESDREALGKKLGIQEAFAVVHLNLALGLLGTIVSFDKDVIENLAKNIGLRGNEASIYEGIPNAVTRRVERLRKSLEFERAAEGHTISPPWYRKQLIAAGFLEAATEANDSLLRVFQRVFIKRSEDLIAEKRGILAAPLLERGLELCNKYAANLEHVEKSINEIEQFKLQDTLPWPGFDSSGSIEIINALQTAIINLFAETIGTLAEYPALDDIPDYFGHAYELLKNVCYLSMSKGDIEQFQKWFPAVFGATILAAPRMEGELEGQSETTKLIFSTEPMLTLLELTGYSILYQEVHEEPFWDFAKSVWDSFLEGKDFAAFGKAIFELVTERRKIFGLAPRDLERTSWQQEFTRRMKLAGYVRERYFYRGDLEEEEELIESRVLRAVIQGEFMLVDARDVFLASYFVDKVEGDTGLPERVKSYLKHFKEDEGKKKGE